MGHGWPTEMADLKVNRWVVSKVLALGRGSEDTPGSQWTKDVKKIKTDSLEAKEDGVKVVGKTSAVRMWGPAR